VLDKKGNVISENRHYIVGNEKYILLEPEKNVFYHGKSPYIIGNPLPVLFRSIGKGLIEDVLGLEDAIVEFTNSQIDNLHWIMLGVNEVDKMAFTPKGQAQLTELYPGKLVEKRTGYQGDAFKHHELGTPPEKAMPLLQELKQFYQQDTSVTEYIQAMPSARAETLGQYEGKRGSAIEDFISIAKHIERTFLVECVDRARDLIIQYMSEFNRYPEIKGIFDEEQVPLENLTTAEKKAMIVTDLDIVGRGISIFFDRQDRLNKLGVYVKMINALGEDGKIYIETAEVIRRINDAFGFERREAMLRTEEQVQQLRQQMAQQQANALQTQLQLEMQKIQTQQQKTLMSFKEEMMKLQQDSIERAKDRQADIALAMLKAK